MNTQIKNNLANIDLEIICSDNIALKVLKVDDISDNYISWLNDYEVVKFSEQRYRTHDFEDVQRFVIEKYNSSIDLLFGIYYQKKHIGNIKLGSIDMHNNVADISYFIGDRDYWNKGIGTEIVKSLTLYGFQNLNLHKIIAYCNPENKSSEKVLIKAGYNIEGIRKEQLFFEEKRLDELVYTICNKN